MGALRGKTSERAGGSPKPLPPGFAPSAGVCGIAKSDDSAVDGEVNIDEATVPAEKVRPCW